MAQSGAILREVGTTNKTRAADYAAAISDRTALLLRVHPSNFRIEGFTERPALADFVAVGRKFNVPVAEDLGSGHLADLGRQAAPDRPGRDRTSTGPSTSRRSSDRGRASTFAASAATSSSADPRPASSSDAGARRPRARAPADARAARRQDDIRRARCDARRIRRRPRVDDSAGPADADRCRRRHSRSAPTRSRPRSLRLDGWPPKSSPGASAVGGGSAPGLELPTSLVAHRETRPLGRPRSRSGCARSTPPVIARIEHDRVLLDLRTVLPAEDDQLAATLKNI